jgi:Regulator of G protein signaling domain
MGSISPLKSASKYLYDESLDGEDSPVRPSSPVSSKVRLKFTHIDGSESDATKDLRNSSVRSKSTSMFFSVSSNALSDGDLRKTASFGSKTKLNKSMDLRKIISGSKPNGLAPSQSMDLSQIVGGIRPTGSEARHIEKIFEDPSELKRLKELSDKFITLHYIEFYQGMRLVKNLVASNPVSEMLLNLINKKLGQLQNVYLNDDSAHNLRLVSVMAKGNFIEGIETFKTSLDSDISEIDIDFMDAAKAETLEVIAKSLYSKVIKEDPPVSTAKTAKGDEVTVQMLIKVLDSETECEKMIEILTKQLCLENYFYYQKQKEVCDLAAAAKNTIQTQLLDEMLKQLGRDFIVSDAPFELNIPSKIRKNFESAIKNHPQVGILEPITDEVLNMMLRNTFPSYVKYYK